MMKDQPSVSSFTGLDSSAKSLLRNVIRHTDTHNRLLEESEMWQRHTKMKSSRGRKRHSDSESEGSGHGRRDSKRKCRSSRDRTSATDDTGDLDVQRSFLYDDRTYPYGDSSWRRGPQRAHMDEVAMATSNGRSGGSTYWMRQLEEAEEKDPERWGHGGFKELYPEDFHSDKSDTEDKSERTRRGKSSDGRKKKRKKDRASSLSRKERRKNERRKSKKRKRKAITDSESDSREEDTVERKRNKNGRKSEKHRNRKRHESDTSYFSQTDSDLKGESRVKDNGKDKNRNKKKSKKKLKKRKARSLTSSGSDSDYQDDSKNRSKFTNERDFFSNISSPMKRKKK